MVLTSSAPPIGPPPMAPRLRRPSMGDRRLLIGILLILVSVALGARAVAAADHTVPVYAARATLPTGTALTVDVLQVVRMRVTGTNAGYLSAAQPVPAGQVVIRTVGAGELVPNTAVAPASRLAVRPVSIPLEGVPPAGLSTGGRVDVWASTKRPDSSGTEYLAPQRIADRVEVFHVDAPGAGLSAARTTAVQVLLPAGELPAVLDALANGARLVLLPVPGSVPAAGGDR